MPNAKDPLTGEDLAQMIAAAQIERGGEPEPAELDDLDRAAYDAVAATLLPRPKSGWLLVPYDHGLHMLASEFWRLRRAGDQEALPSWEELDDEAKIAKELNARNWLVSLGTEGQGEDWLRSPTARYRAALERIATEDGTPAGDIAQAALAGSEQD